MIMQVIVVSGALLGAMGICSNVDDGAALEVAVAAVV